MFRLIIPIISSIIAFSSFANGKDCAITKIEINKFTREIHLSGSYDCAKYDAMFASMSVYEQPFIDTVINNKNILVKFQSIFEQYKISSNVRCHGRPQIKITFFYKSGKQIHYYIEQYAYILNLDKEPELTDEWIINFLKLLGGFV